MNLDERYLLQKYRVWSEEMGERRPDEPNAMASSPESAAEIYAEVRETFDWAQWKSVFIIVENHEGRRWNIDVQVEVEMVATCLSSSEFKENDVPA